MNNIHMQLTEKGHAIDRKRASTQHQNTSGKRHDSLGNNLRCNGFKLQSQSFKLSNCRQKKWGAGGTRGRGVGQRPASPIICELF